MNTKRKIGLVANQNRLPAVALVILAGVGAAGAGDGRALEAAASWSAPRPLDVARALLPFVVGGRPPSECDPSYPTVCLPPPPPDLDCPEVLPLVNFPALPADPHHLDADKDGIACESP